MKIIEIRPVRVKQESEHSATGLVDVVYIANDRWWRPVRRKFTRRAFSTTGILWAWLDRPGWKLHDVTEMIDASIPELVDGETIRVLPAPGDLLVEHTLT